MKLMPISGRRADEFLHRLSSSLGCSGQMEPQMQGTRTRFFGGFCCGRIWIWGKQGVSSAQKRLGMLSIGASGPIQACMVGRPHSKFPPSPSRPRGQGATIFGCDMETMRPGCSKTALKERLHD